MSLIAGAFLSLTRASMGSMMAFQATQSKSVVIELANAELESLRAARFDALGVSDVDPARDAAYPGSLHDGKQAVVLSVDVLRAADPTFPDPPAAITTVTESAVEGLRAPYTVRRWVTWMSAGTSGPKNVEVTVEWTDDGERARSLSLGSIVYPGGEGPAAGNSAPVASFTASPTSGTAPLVVNLNASTSTDVDGTIQSYNWQFGNGASATTATPTTSYTYATNGTFTVVLTVTDDAGLAGTATRSIAVASNQPPVASFTVSPSSGAKPLTVSVNGSASSDPEGGPLTYQWTWGDATANGSGVTTTHAYTGTGTYTLTLKVTDNRGLFHSTTQTISTICQITAGSLQNNPTGTPKPPINEIQLLSTNKPVNRTVRFDATSNRLCTTMTVSIPRSGGTVTLALAKTGTPGPTTQLWTGTTTVSASIAFVLGANQTGTYTGSSSVTQTFTFTTYR